ncbi:CPBP family intramembrane glutamic endopeptidase [Actinomadura sp. WAC 06369]|uniref:CPBP family intramembrane glutamic endopeptidase n=1 Tax=Actinomadura sp. WAC 06369 TaxID=2203193 RepID=UPI000F7AAFFB|nr:type II CAAX endopeptidase family protein [Actinomadura sp. WAC 06369]RSN46641.1 CPBP family intramembrane metalloprotease domain-containing protein [Actinomadura sp. WAC 06369]
MRLLKQLVTVAAVAFIGGAVAGAVQDVWYLTLIAGLATAALAVPAYTWIVGRTERRAVTELAAQGAAFATVRGMLIGTAMFAVVIGHIYLLGGYHVEGFGSLTGAVGILGFMAAAAVTEELLFRGVLFRIIEERIGTYLALALTGIVFGLMHMANPDANLWGALAIAIEAGGMLAAAYAATRNLWVPIGLHFAWNFAQGGIFSTQVSGNGDSEGLLESSTSGPVLLSGGDFGPEASGYAVLAGAVLTVVFMWLAHRRGHVVPRRGRDRAAATATLAQ